MTRAAAGLETKSSVDLFVKSHPAKARDVFWVIIVYIYNIDIH